MLPVSDASFVSVRWTIDGETTSRIELGIVNETNPLAVVDADIPTADVAAVIIDANSLVKVIAVVGIKGLVVFLPSVSAIDIVAIVPPSDAISVTARGIVNVDTTTFTVIVVVVIQTAPVVAVVESIPVDVDGAASVVITKADPITFVDIDAFSNTVDAFVVISIFVATVVVIAVITNVGDGNTVFSVDLSVVAAGAWLVVVAVSIASGI